MAIGPTKWLTVCLHYNEPWEELLTKAVRPYVEVVLQTGVAERFFFERSWDRGPHIRLWFKSTEDLLENMLMPNLLEYFQQYFEAKPSFLVLPTHAEVLPDKHKWHPNNSVQFESFQNEYEWQLGWQERALMEAQFQASSFLVLNNLKERRENWSQTEKISCAIKLHLGMLYAFGMSQKEAWLFSDWAYKNWVAEQHPNTTVLNHFTESEAIYKEFQSIFDLQSKDILPYHSAIWELLKNYRKIGEKSFVDWIHVNTNANLELCLALDTHQLQRRITPVEPSESIWTFYTDLIHKTNNRLGINRKNEGYLYFLLAQSFRYLQQGYMAFSSAESARISAA
ncbi:MAG: hypothetical protein GC192_00490 [Bacteroidetes bacterium]|nr:hypothetical protein [Bacteroidota bacterium]